MQNTETMEDGGSPWKSESRLSLLYEDTHFFKFGACHVY